MSDLVPKNPGALTTGGGFWGQMEQTDFAIPHVTLGQPMSQKEGVEAGKYCFNNGRKVSVIEGGVLIYPLKTRVLYAGLNKGSRCASDNYYTPASRIKDPISQSCLTCVATKWGETDPAKLALAREIGAQRLGNPLCKETYNCLMAVWHDGDFMPFFIAFQSAALKVVSEKLFSNLRFNWSKHAPYHVAFDMGVVELKGQGRYFQPTFGNFRLVPPEHRERLDQLYHMHSQSAQAALAQDHEAMDAEWAAKEQTPDPF